MNFNCFPKKQHLFLVYSSYAVFRSRLFNDLVLQSSPKNSIFFRFLRTNTGFLISSLLRFNIDIPNLNAEYIGIIKGDAKILFEMENNNPVWVWRKNEKEDWKKESFLGYQLISEYTIKEFELKYKIIEKALKLHWDSFNTESTEVHGDLTHFNILNDGKGNILFIDNKSHENSKLFDFFYFYAYLKQCLSINVTLSVKDRKLIVENIESILKGICKYRSDKEFNEDFKQIIVPKISGLRDGNEKLYLQDFSSIFNTA